jgi:HrpA-like RNA helicase
VEPNIPHDAAVTIVGGGTGSGKTTRYPLMLSLFSPTGPLTKVVVAQPRRLACQTAAKRVATEQDVEIGSPGCPIGYAIRFEAFLASADSRTVDFLTPGVLLRRAMDDPLLRDITHLCIDEVHERNADMDLLLALAKQALQKRINHPTLPPLRVILMSATLDSEHWESYFSGGRGDKKVNVEVIDVPGIRRFPINIVHLDDPAFPVRMQPLENFLARPKAAEKQAEFDEVLCDATAKLVSHLIERGSMKNGSILCFLPGIEEIRRVDQLLGQAHCRTNVLYLHSSLSSAEQAKVFVPGPKVILSTNIGMVHVQRLCFYCYRFLMLPFLSSFFKKLKRPLQFLILNLSSIQGKF